MKKFLIMLLCAAMLISLIGCAPSNPVETNGTEAPEESPFMVGYGREEFTPDFSVAMPGFGNTSERMSTGVLDPLCVTAIAFRDADGNTAILFTSDTTTSNKTVTSSIRSAVKRSTGIPEGNIMFTSTHTHSSADIVNPMVQTRLTKAATKAAETAVADLAPAEIYIGSAETEGLNFVRHYVQEAGTFVGDNFGNLGASPIVGHATEADKEMQLIKFARESKDIILMNFQAHPTITGSSSKTNFSADFIGACRMAMESKVDCHFAYFTGAAGNLNAGSRIASENAVASGDYQAHGNALAGYAIKALDNMTKVNAGEVKVLTQTYEGTVAHDDGELAVYVPYVNAAYEEGGAAEAQKVGQQYGIHSVFHARAIASRATLGKTLNMEIGAISIGDVSFITAPYEMFDTNGMAIKENTPFEMTFLLTLANDHFYYIASEYAFEYGCYEVDTRKFVKGTAENLVDIYLSMLAELKSGE